MGRILIMALAAALLGGCSNGAGGTIDRPVGEVEAMLQASEALAFAAHLPGTGHSVEAGGGRVVWHFTLNDQDYARMNIALAQAGPEATKVTTSFEEVNDASGPGVPYLRGVARAVSEESVAAAVEGRSVDMAALQNRFKTELASDPMAVSGATRQIWDEAIRVGEASTGTQTSSSGQPYDKTQAYGRTPVYDRN